jgi:KUP system potassium uptake protein
VIAEPLSQGFIRVTVSYGFMEEPDIPAALGTTTHAGTPIVTDDTTYFVGTETLIATKRPGMPLWRERLFVLMSRNAVRATSFFRTPPDRVMEVGMQVEL